MCSGTGTPCRSASRTSEPVMSSISVGLLCFDVLEHRRIVRRPAPRREHVHLPRILVELDPGRRRDRLALVDELVDEVAEVAGLLLRREVRVVRQPGERGDGVHRRVEDRASTTAPAAGPASDLRLRARRLRAARRSPRRRRTACPRTAPATSPCRGCTRTSVSECFVPDMNVTAETIGQSPCARTTSSAPSPLSVVIIVASGKRPSSDAAASSSPFAFVATIPRSNGSSSSGSVARRDATRAGRSARSRAARRGSSASACSRRRVSTETSTTCARWPANRLPIDPGSDDADTPDHATCATSVGAARGRAVIDRRGEELLVLDRHPVRRAAGVDGDRRSR